MKSVIALVCGVSGVVALHGNALARDAMIGPRIELRGTWSELLANDYDAGYCYAYVGTDQCVSYPSKTLSSQTSVGGEVGYDAPLGSSATIGVYGRYDLGSGSNQDGNLTYNSKDNYAIGAKIGYGRKKANVYFKLGYQSWTVKTTEPNIGFDANGNPAVLGPAIVSTSHLGGLDIALGTDVAVAGKFYIGGEIGGGVLGKDASVSGLDTPLKTLRLAVKIGTHF